MMDHEALEGRQKTHSNEVHIVTHSKNKTMGKMKFEAITPYTQHIKKILVRMSRRINKTFLNKTWIHYLPFGLNNISSRKWTAAQ
jgi:hypothetical protein